MLGQVPIPNAVRVLFARGTQSRGVERIRRAGLTGLASVIAQGITIAAGFISVPLTIGYLGNERYGIWLTINSLLQWLYISQMGLSGNALINKLSEANGKDDKSLARELVATAFWSLAALTLIFSLGFAAVSPFIEWTAVFNTPDSVSGDELRIAMAVAFFCFVMMFPTSMVDAVYQSYQEGFIGNIWNIAGSLASLIALVAVTRMEGGLPLLIAALFGVRILFSFINAVYLFFFRHSWLKPSPRAVTPKSFRGLMGLGWRYLIAQLSGIGMFRSQLLIITQILGPASVAVFGVNQSLLTLPLTVIQILFNPFMPAYGEAKARGDWGWIKRNLYRTTVLAAAGSIAMVLPLSLAAKTIVYYWAGADMVPSDGLILWFAIYVVVGCVVTPVSIMLYGLEHVGAQALLTFLNAVLNVCLGIALTQFFGITGMVAAMAVALLLVNPVGQILQLRVIFKDNAKRGKDK